MSHFLLLFFLPVAVQDGSGHPKSVMPRVDQRYWPTDTWRTATPEGQGIDSELLETLRDQCIRKDMGSMVLSIDIQSFAVFSALGKHDQAKIALGKALALSEKEG